MKLEIVVGDNIDLSLWKRWYAWLDTGHSCMVFNRISCFLLIPRGQNVKTRSTFQNLTNVSFSLTAPFWILENLERHRRRCILRKNIFAKKIFFTLGDFPHMRNFWKMKLMTIFYEFIEKLNEKLELESKLHAQCTKTCENRKNKISCHTPSLNWISDH